MYEHQEESAIPDTELHDTWRRAPIYTLAEAAHLTNVHPVTVKRWLNGDGDSPPVVKGDGSRQLVSFLTLVEIAVAKLFRQRNVRLERIRKAHDFAARRMETDYPFAFARLAALGGHILAEFQEESPGGGSLLALEHPSEQWTLPGLVIETLSALDFEADLASRWFPLGREVPIVIDPRFAAGMPTIAERRVTVETIRKRFKTGMSIDFIADDLRLDNQTIEDAVRYGDLVAA